MDLKEIQNLIKFVAKSGASEVKLEMEDVKITIRTGESHKGDTTIVQQSPPGQYEITSVGPEVTTKALTDACDCFIKEANSGIAVFSGLLPPGAADSTYRDLIERINQQGGRAVLDSHGETLQLSLEAKPWLVRFNRYVLEMLMQRRVDTLEHVAEVARLVQQQGVGMVCVSLGDKGAILLDDDNSYYCDAPKVHKKSTVGSGDSLVSGLIASALNNSLRLSSFNT